jgi:hypothetical protein
MGIGRKRKRGKAMFEIEIPEGSSLVGFWELPAEQIGLLVMLHRAILIEGAESSGVLPIDIVESIIEKQSSESAVEALVDAKLLAFDTAPPGHIASCRVLTWAPMQGAELERAREAARCRKKRQRSRVTPGQRSRVTTDNPPEQLGKSRGGGEAGAGGMSRVTPGGTRPNVALSQGKSPSRRDGSPPDSPAILDSSSSSSSSSSEKKREKRTKTYATRAPVLERRQGEGVSVPAGIAPSRRGENQAQAKPPRPQETFLGAGAQRHSERDSVAHRRNEGLSADQAVARGQGVLLPPETTEEVIVDKVTQEWAELVPMREVPGDLREFVVKLHRGYPRVDLLEQGRIVAAWWDANPSKRKTRKGLKRFLNSWMSRSASKAVAPPPVSPPPSAMDADKRRRVAGLWGDPADKGARRGK